MNAETLARALGGRRTGSHWMAPCPTHEDRDPSLSIRDADHGKVLVGVRRNGGSARIEVWDTGPGIAEEDQNAIFEEFRRLDTTASRNEGLGLGLAIVERACARLGHPIALWSEPGRGSSFSVTISEPGPDREQGALKGSLILLVHRDVAHRARLALALEAEGADVIEADDPQDATTLLADLEIEPDAVALEDATGTSALYTRLAVGTGLLPGCVMGGASGATGGLSALPRLPAPQALVEAMRPR